MPEDKINWEKVRQEAFTAIRAKFLVLDLLDMSTYGFYTPVSGDRLTKMKRERRD